MKDFTIVKKLGWFYPTRQKGCTARTTNSVLAKQHTVHHGRVSMGWVFNQQGLGAQFYSKINIDKKYIYYVNL